MRVYIGPYKNYWGPYQIADLLQKVGVSEERCDKIGEWLGETWVNDFCQWVYKKRGERKVKVRIDYYDTWSMDSTLAPIVLPMLKQLKETKHGAPVVDVEDVPEELRPTQEELDKYAKDGSTDDKFFERWDWVMDQMIFAFESEFNDWEDQFRSGKSDIVWTPVDVKGNEVPEEDAKLYRMDSGPNDTYKVDWDGYKAYAERIQNGYRLFGKYFQALWD